jgi:hypothetical protein
MTAARSISVPPQASPDGSVCAADAHSPAPVGWCATQNANLPFSGSGFISSLEAGYPFPWLGPTFVLEPEGQIIWQR